MRAAVESLRIANCSGFYGDRASAAREMVTGGPIDVLTGDYLAELTMLILWKASRRSPDGGGYATSFYRQMEDVLAACAERGIKVVSNAGGLNPGALAARLRELSRKLGLDLRIAHVTGDNILPRLPQLREAGEGFVNLDTGRRLDDVSPVVTANAYLGGWGIAEALRAGADIVVTGRVTDAALCLGPAAWRFGWRADDWDALAGAVAAGHVIECGPQATGGNYPFFQEIADLRHPGFPIAEIRADGSSVITKHPGTGGAVTVGTVTAQLLYEIGPPLYLNPDVTSDFSTLAVTQQGPDRVALSGARGYPPPDTLKVAMTLESGWRNSVEFILTGLAIEEKAALLEGALLAEVGGSDQYSRYRAVLNRTDRADAPSNDLASATMRFTVTSPDKELVGRRFSSAATGLGLGNYPGLYLGGPPQDATAVGTYWPATVSRDVVRHEVTIDSGASTVIRPSPHTASPAELPQPAADPEASWSCDCPVRRVPLGTIVGGRSGDKGGNANLGVWTRDKRSFGWLRATLTTERLREVVPDCAQLPIDRYELANLYALNFVVHGLLGSGAAAAERRDAQAKSLAEYFRSRVAAIPECLLDGPACSPVAGE